MKQINIAGKNSYFIAKERSIPESLRNPLLDWLEWIKTGYSWLVLDKAAGIVDAIDADRRYLLTCIQAFNDILSLAMLNGETSHIDAAIMIAEADKDALRKRDEAERR